VLHSKIRPVGITLVVVLLLATTSLSSYSSKQSVEPKINPIVDSQSLAYSTHAPVVITRDSDFETQGWSGQGTSSSPYSITNLNITSNSVMCILIANTTSYFTIQNCWLSSEGAVWGQGVITLDNVINGRVVNNIIAEGHIAICVDDSSSCTFSGNAIGSSLTGFLAYNLHNSDFSENYQTSESMGYSVHIEDSSNVDIIDNFFQDCVYEAIGLTNCHDCQVTLNVLSGTNLHIGQYGLAIRNSRDCTLSQNNVTGFGTAIEVTEGQFHTIENNYIDTCWGGVMVRGNDTTVAYNEIDTTGFCVQLRESFRSIVSSNELDGTDFTTGVDVSCGGYSQIIENTISELEFGMRLQGVTNLEVVSNRIVDCYVAITFEEVAYLTLEDGPPNSCRILYNQFEQCGFRFSITDPAGMNHEIIGNLVNGRPLAYLYGANNIRLDGRDYGQVILADCEDVSINGGILDQLLLMFCTDCEISGISIINSTNGVYIRYSSQIDVGYSHFMGNDVGIRIELSNHCHVVSTSAFNNGHGLLLDGSPNSGVYDCNLYDNEYGMVLIGAHNSYVESNRVYSNIQGVYLLRTEESFVGNNDILENEETGLLLNRGSRFNKIIANSFGWNSINVLCYGFDNVWDDGVKKGNSWSDLGDSIIYMIDEDDFDRFPRSLWEERPTNTTGPITTATNSTDVPEIVTVAIGAVAGFSILSLCVVAVRFVRGKPPS
jgi:parallel beta-helix repeat protein